MKFDLLVQSIADVHRQMQARAVQAVNVGLTLRNWLIGAYIAEYELRGEDRAAYGTALFSKLSHSLSTKGLSGVNARELPRFRKLYDAYPQILGSLTPEFPKQLFVSRYQLELPATAELEAFLKRELEQWKEERE